VEELTLPSGAVVKAKRPKTQSLLSNLPSSVLGAMNKAIETDDDRADQFRAAAAYRLHVVVATLVEPKVLIDPTTDTDVDVEDIPSEDLDYLLAFAEGGMEAAEATREGETFRDDVQSDTDAAAPKARKRS